MKFSTREDIEAPIESVFEMLCDFEVYERAAMRRGAEIRRTDDLANPGLGAAWNVRFVMQGKERDVALEVVSFDPPDEIKIALNSRNIIGTAQLELFALSRNRTRILVGIEVTPITLKARLFLQSLKLKKASLTRQYKDRVAGYVKELEERHQA